MRWTLASLILATGFWNVALGQEVDANLKSEIEQAEATLKKANVALDTPALLNYFKQRTLSPQDEEKLKDLVLKLGHQSYPARVAAMTTLLKAGSLAMPFLQFGLKADDQEIARRAEICLNHLLDNSDADSTTAAAFLLGQRKADGAAKAMLDFLPFAVDQEVVQHIRTALGQLAIKDKEIDPAFLAALKDKFAVRRGAAGEALAFLPAQRGAVALLLKDPEPRVRLWVSLALLKAKDAQAVPVLISLLDQLPEQEIWQAEEALLRLAGESAPSTDTAIDPKTGKAGKLWTQWLKGHNGDMDKLLKDFSETGSHLNCILYTQMPIAGGINGEVVEMGPNKNTMWSINGLRYPVDAQVIGPKRVLIAEYLNRKVVEMDFKGVPKWTYEIDQPVGCQLLANGNIFIAGRRQLVEVTRDQKIKFNYGSPTLYVASARKLPNGDVVLVDNNGKLTILDGKGNPKGQAITVGRVYTLGGHIDVLPGNRILVPEYTNHQVVEYTLQGEIKWKVKVNWPTCAVRLPNGHTLVASMINQQLLRFDQNGNETWSYKTTGRPWCVRSR